MYSTEQRCLRIFAHLDILIFFGVFFGSAITETYICQTKPISLYDYYYINFLGLFSTPNKTISENDSVLNECVPNNTEQKICKPVLKETEQSQNTLWDCRIHVIDRARDYGGQGLYHVAYLLCWLIIVTYFVMEIFQYCILLKGINVRRQLFLNKWMGFRFLVLAIATAICVYDLSGFQVTCTDVFVIPFIGFRLLHFLIVGYFTCRAKVRSSTTETIVLTANEKL